MKKEQAVEKRDARPLAMSVFDRSEHQTSVIDNSDIVLPRLLLSQGLSKSVANGETQMGDIHNSLTKTIIAGKGKKSVIIPLTVKKCWRIFHVINGKRTYRGTEPFTPSNATWKWEEIGPGGEKIENDITLDFYVFTEDDLKDAAALPSVLSFSRTGYKVGQKFATLLKTMEQARLAYCARMYTVDSVKQQNDKGIFYVFDISPKMEDGKHQATPAAYAEKLKNWIELLETKSVVVDVAEDEVQSGAGEGAGIDNTRF